MQCEYGAMTMKTTKKYFYYQVVGVADLLFLSHNYITQPVASVCVCVCVLLRVFQRTKVCAIQWSASCERIGHPDNGACFVSVCVRVLTDRLYEPLR